MIIPGMDVWVCNWCKKRSESVPHGDVPEGWIAHAERFDLMQLMERFPEMQEYSGLVSGNQVLHFDSREHFEEWKANPPESLEEYLKLLVSWRGK